LKRASAEVLDPFNLSLAGPGAVPHAVEVQNDDYTPMLFVVRLLKQCFGLNHDEAVQTVLKIHGEGKAVIGTASEHQAREIAEYMVCQAQKYGHPLKCESVSAQQGAPSDVPRPVGSGLA